MCRLQPALSLWLRVVWTKFFVRLIALITRIYHLIFCGYRPNQKFFRQTQSFFHGNWTHKYSLFWFEIWFEFRCFKSMRFCDLSVCVWAVEKFCVSLYYLSCMSTSFLKIISTRRRKREGHSLLQKDFTMTNMRRWWFLILMLPQEGSSQCEGWCFK